MVGYQGSGTHATFEGQCANVLCETFKQTENSWRQTARIRKAGLASICNRQTEALGLILQRMQTIT